MHRGNDNIRLKICFPKSFKYHSVLSCDNLLIDLLSLSVFLIAYEPLIFTYTTEKYFYIQVLGLCIISMK